MVGNQTKYYDPKAAGIRSLFTWSATVFELVIKKKEFWCYIMWNMFLTSACIFAVPDNKVDEFNWDAASIMQYVMTFFVTFYNEMCFQRYEKLYPEVINFSESAIDIVCELCVNLHWWDLATHRIACAKYLLAIVYCHFMLVCGGKMEQENWNELISKGLLSPQEVALLSDFPGGKVQSILSCWIMFVIKDALVQDCMWRKNSKASDVSQQTVHIYNRFVKHIVSMVKSCNQTGYLLAVPIPFAYYHLMNFILLFNIMLLATFSALFKSYASVFPFGIALLIYMGLREVSCALADPFGEDAVDFDMPDILRNCFDRAVSVLLAFHREDSRKWVLKQIANVEEFEERHLRRPCKPNVFAEAPGSSGVVFKGPPACHMKWTSESHFEDALPGVDIRRKMKYSLNPKGPPPPEEEDERDPMDNDEIRQHKAHAACEMEEERGRDLLLERDDLEHEYSRITLVLEELEEKFPILLEYPAPDEDPHMHRTHHHHHKKVSSKQKEAKLAAELKAKEKAEKEKKGKKEPKKTKKETKEAKAKAQAKAKAAAAAKAKAKAKA